jgi:hypothetical protein
MHLYYRAGTRTYGCLARTRVVVGGRGDAKYYSGALLDLVKLRLMALMHRYA